MQWQVGLPDDSIHKEIIVNLKIKKIATEIYETKKEGVKEILKVTFESPAEGIVIALKGAKASHPLRNWDKRVLDTKDDIVMTLSVPKINQKKLDDFGITGK